MTKEIKKNPLLKCIYHDLFAPIEQRKVDKFHKDPKPSLKAFMTYVRRGQDKFVQRYTTTAGEFLFDKLYLDLDMTPAQLIVSEMKRTPSILDNLPGDDEFAKILEKRTRYSDGVETFVDRLTDKEAKILSDWIKENSTPLTIEDIEDGYLSEVWKQACKVRDYFKQHGIEAYMSWSGKKGIHINIPLETLEFKEPLLAEQPREFLLALLETLEEKVLEEKIGTTSLDRAVQCKGMQRVPGSRHGGTGFYANFIKPSWTYQEAVDVLEDPKCDYVPGRIDKAKNTQALRELPLMHEVVQKALADNEAVRKGENSDACYTITAKDSELIANIKKLYREGQRNVVGSRIVGVLKRAGFSKDKITSIFQEIHDDKEFHNTIGGAINYAFKPGAKVFGMSSLLKCIQDYAFEEDKKTIMDFFLRSFKYYNPNTPQPYQLPSKLENAGWKWLTNGVYVPWYSENLFNEEKENPRTLNDETDMRDIYLHLQRGKGNSKMRYTFVELSAGEYVQQVSTQRNKLLNEEDISDNGKMKINKSISYMGQKIGLLAKKEAYVDFMDMIFQAINIYLPVFREDDYNIEKETEVTEDTSLADIIEARKNPQLTDGEIAIAREVQAKIKEQGLTRYLDSMIVTMHVGSTKNIQQKVFIGFGTANGTLSMVNINKAIAGAGKSHENEIGYNTLMPKEYVLNKNRITKASLTMYGEENPQFLTRQTVILGDVGSENANKEIIPLFDVLKVLVTEKEYSEDKADGSMQKGFTKKTQELKVESITAVVETPANKDYTFDSQIESRSFEQTPTEEDFMELSKFIMAVSTPGSKQQIAMEQALAEAEKFHTYIRWLIGQHVEIINPYLSIFQKLSKNEESRVREFKTQLALFNSYCILTMHECDEENGKLVASKKQVLDFANNLTNHNGLTPNEHAFVMMIKNYKNVGTIIHDDSAEEEDQDENARNEKNMQGEDDNVFELDEIINTAMRNTKINKNRYFTTTVEDINDDMQDMLDSLQFEDLNKQDTTAVLNKLLSLYGLGQRKNIAHRLVFRKKDIMNKFKNSRSYKNVKDDIDNTLTSLINKGYMLKLDGKAMDDWKVYCLTNKCRELENENIITDEDWKVAEEFMEFMGF